MAKKIKQRRKKYGVPTEMLASRVPVDVVKAIERKARRHGLPKSEVVIDVLKLGLARAPEPSTEGAFD